jgi:hypothetical protein
VDSQTKAPIAGQVLVAIEQPDKTGTDRIMMQTAADASGNFRFCPLPTGTFDIVVVAVGPKNLPYNATAIVNVPNGTNLNVPLLAETGATAPAVLQGVVTATTGTAGATADVALSALQQISVGMTAREITVPLQTIPATATTPEVDSTGLISVASSMSCPTGAPANTNCAQYTLVVPASNPNIGVFASSGVTFTAPASGDVLLSVDAQATVPMNAPANGGAADCAPSEIVMAKDATNMPLKVTAAMTTNVGEIDFKGCS